MKVYLALFSITFFTCFYSQNITNVSPNSGYAGTYSLPVSISGVNTNFDQATVTYIEFSQGTNTSLTINNVNSITSSSIDLDLQIKHTDNTGFYDVNFYGLYPQGAEQYSAYSAFEVATSTVNPAIIMSSPQKAVLDQQININISTRATHFLQATNTSVWFSQGTSTILFADSENFNTDTSYSGAFTFSSAIYSIGNVLDLNIDNSFDGYLYKPQSITITSGTAINGTVYDTFGSPVSCTVELYQQIDSYNSQPSFVFINSTYSSNGSYSFTNIPSDNYVIRAVPNVLSGLYSAYYSSSIPGAQFWSDAEVISSSVSMLYNIYLNGASSQSGTGSISGTITSAEGFTKQYFPVENARITCSSSNYFYETYSDISGSYVLSGLPNDTYTVLVDIPGKTQPDVSTLTISSGNEIISENNYLVYQDLIIRSFVGTENESTIGVVKIYPNPSTDYITFELEYFPQSTIPLKIFDAQGRFIASINAQNKITQIDINYLPNGQYFLSGIINGKLCVAQIIKQ